MDSRDPECNGGPKLAEWPTDLLLLCDNGSHSYLGIHLTDDANGMSMLIIKNRYSLEPYMGYEGTGPGSWHLFNPA